MVIQVNWLDWHRCSRGYNNDFYWVYRVMGVYTDDNKCIIRIKNNEIILESKNEIIPNMHTLNARKYKKTYVAGLEFTTESPAGKVLNYGQQAIIKKVAKDFLNKLRSEYDMVSKVDDKSNEAFVDIITNIHEHAVKMNHLRLESAGIKLVFGNKGHPSERHKLV